MSVRLKDRLRQIPGGLRFRVPALKNWEPPAYSSFDTIVRGVMVLRRANPYHTEKNKWATDYESVANEVDEYNAMVCKAAGWKEYYVEYGGVAPPKTQPRLLQSVAHVVAGAKLLAEWLGEGGKAVPTALSAQRAEICARGNGDTPCPQNGPGDWTRYFTLAASEKIRKQLSMRSDLGLSTPDDPVLGICEACGCPLKLKVHTPARLIEEHTTQEELAAMPPYCWVRRELEAALNANAA